MHYNHLGHPCPISHELKSAIAEFLQSDEKKVINTPLNQLLNTLPRRGKVEWIGLRPAKRVSMKAVSRVELSTETGLIGDRYAGRSGERQITLIQAEHLPAIAAYLGLEEIAPELLRRNLLITGINLLALKSKVINIGTAQIEITGQCHPCSRMEEIFGPGGYNAVRGHGGITARVIKSGELSVGDPVWYHQVQI